MARPEILAPHGVFCHADLVGFSLSLCVVFLSFLFLIFYIVRNNILVKL